MASNLQPGFAFPTGHLNKKKNTQTNPPSVCFSFDEKNSSGLVGQLRFCGFNFVNYICNRAITLVTTELILCSPLTGLFRAPKCFWGMVFN